MKIGDLVKVIDYDWLWDDIGVVTDISDELVTVRWTEGHTQKWLRKNIQIVNKKKEDK